MQDVDLVRAMENGGGLHLAELRVALDDMVARLSSAGVAIEADFRWPGGARSIYFRDPAGNSLECASRTLWIS